MNLVTTFSQVEDTYGLRILTNQVKFEVIRETTSFDFIAANLKSSVPDVMKFLPFLLIVVTQFLSAERCKLNVPRFH
jgi:hypothetical protein